LEVDCPKELIPKINAMNTTTAFFIFI